MTFEWTELAYQEILAGNTMISIFPLCVLLVYVVLAAQYESWTLPLSVILIVPMTLLCAIAGVWLTGGDNNVFTQISFLVLAGLACKNAILIVEFARAARARGRGRTFSAILDACRIRLRPVLMTSVAFIMGVVPLVFSSGAGAEIRQAMGIAVFAGMLGVTVFGLFLTPVFYVVDRRWVVERMLRRRRAGCSAAPQRPRRGGALIMRRLDSRDASCDPCFALAACAVRRRTRRPRRDRPRWRTPIRRSSCEQPYDPRWWRQFEDPVLDTLEAAALRVEPRRAHRRRARRAGARGLRRRRRSIGIRQ